VGREDWYRNRDWNEAIESAFRKKLSRARQQADQYLRIQALYLRHAHPEVALSLLLEFFELKDPFDKSSAYNQMAKIYSDRGEHRNAVLAYRKSLEEEARKPNIKSGSDVDFPFYVANYGLSEYYDEAAETLDKAALVFHTQVFMANAALAMIAADKSQYELAQQYALAAMEAAGARRSPFARHPDIGLVGKEFEPTIVELEAIVETGKRKTAKLL
jgi:tetratricopeptide (TPR) repeat protein